MAKHNLMLEDRVEVVAQSSSEENLKLEILYSNHDALVINKPAGIECVDAERPLEKYLRIEFPGARIVHRLDRDTSGCLLATKSEAAWDFFVGQFKDFSIKKSYLAILSGHLPHARNIVNSAIDGKSAKSIFHRMASSSDFTLSKIELLTGRTHQIRKHVQELNCALLGDRNYGSQSMQKFLRSVPRQMLHAASIEFSPTLNEEKVLVNAPIPPDFLSWQKRLKLFPRS